MSPKDSKPLCILLCDVGAVLEDRSAEEVAAFGAAEAKKANAALKAIAADVKKTIATGIADVKRDVAAVGEKVDAVAAKVGRGRGRGKCDDDTIAFCAAVLSAAESNATIKNGLNTRVTHGVVFDYNRRELESRGVSDVAEFTRIIRAHQAREQRRREKSAAQPSGKTPAKNGIMHGMKKNVHSAFALSLAIACGMASPLRSDASTRKDLTPPPRSSVAPPAASVRALAPILPHSIPRHPNFQHLTNLIAATPVHWRWRCFAVS